jgi:hypothetical protein
MGQGPSLPGGPPQGGDAGNNKKVCGCVSCLVFAHASNDRIKTRRRRNTNPLHRLHAREESARRGGELKHQQEFQLVFSCICFWYSMTDPSTVTPHTKCKLRLLKLERIKDYLLMEEEFITNQERLKPQEEKTQVTIYVCLPSLPNPHDGML